MDIYKLRGRFVLDRDENMQTLLFPILNEVDSMYWLTCQQSSMVGDWYLYGDNEDILYNYLVNTEPFQSGTLKLHRPGMISAYGNVLTLDEVSYFFSLKAENDEEATRKGVILFSQKKPENINIANDIPGTKMIENPLYRELFISNDGLAYIRFDAYTGPDAFWIVAFNNSLADLSKPFFEYHSHMPNRTIEKI